MAAILHRFRSKQDKFTDNQAGELRQLLLDFSTSKGLPQEAVSRVIGSIDQRTASAAGWTFVMISPQQNKQVYRWLRKNSKRPIVATDLWMEVFTALRIDTGEICLSRSEIAEKIGALPRDVSSVMTELESINAIIRRRAGRGVRYYMNPNIATHRTGVDRDKAQEQTGQINLRIIEGDKTFLPNKRKV